MTPAKIEEKTRGIISLMASDFETAETLARELVNSEPDSVRALTVLAYLQNYRRDYTSALETLKQIIAIDPDDLMTLFNLGYCSQQSGKLNQAVEYFGKAAQAGGDNQLEAALLQNLCQSWLGNIEQANVGFAEIYQRAGGHPFATFYHNWQLGFDETTRPFNDNFNNQTAPALMSFINRYDHNCWAGLDDKGVLSSLIANFTATKKTFSFSFWPKSYVMPDQHSQMIVEQGSTKTSPAPLWLVKPTALFGGQGISLTRNVNKAPRKAGWIVQKYIENPLLVHNRKSHIRLYLLIGRLDPVRSWLWHDGIVRFAPQEWAVDGQAADDIDRHITNTQRFLGHEGFEESALPGGPVWSLSAFLGKTGHAEKIQTGLLALARAVTSLIATADLPGTPKTSSIPPKLLGLDVLIDDDLSPWLLEIERYPALSGGNAETANTINAAMFTAAAQLISSPKDTKVKGWLPVS